MATEIPDEMRQAHIRLVAAVLNCLPHRIVGSADAGDFRDRADHMKDMARIFDAYFLAIGADCKQHAPCGSFDIKLFASPCMDAIEGNALYEIESAAERIEDDQREFDADRRGWARASELGVD